MNLIPKPLIIRLVLTILVGTAFFIIGIAFFVKESDTSFLLLSSFICICSLIKAFTTFRIIKKKTYVIIEGKLLSIKPLILKKAMEVILLDDTENEIRLLIDKHHRLMEGRTYRFYFKDSIDFASNTPLLERAVFSDLFLGVEEIPAKVI